MRDRGFTRRNDTIIPGSMTGTTSHIGRKSIIVPPPRPGSQLQTARAAHTAATTTEARCSQVMFVEVTGMIVRAVSTHARH
ncbi:hypothetical protein GCM10009662_60160 [Catellatospora coxensis]|uniref:Uncharacterized protein n=1 Tax=Catellatospora coxensis TaxID=310354 RepID=A0A8J3KVI4_9ACTN|nr:hypothetical protein Cco03nite_36580 [Catellatospora coxensis]